MSKTTEFLGWANVLNYDPSKKDAAGPVVGFPTVGFGDISNAYKTSLIPKTAPGSVGGAFSPSAFLNSVQSGGAMQSGVGAAQEQTPVGGVGDTKDTSAGAGFVPNQILVDSLTKKLFGQKSAGEADTGKLEFDAWKGQFGIDTDKNFQDSVSRLDYEVKTWAANYGANAERLARMGLSNSGVVDVYGTGVVQAYLSAMNDLYLAKAEGDRKNAEAYKQYSDQYDADLAARTEAQAQQDQADINTAIDQLIKSGYTAKMAESAADIYRAKGWSEEKIAKVIQGANGLAGMAPKVDKVKEKYAQIISSQSGYNSSMDGQLSQMLSVAEDWTEEEINELLGYLHDFEAAGKSGASDQALIDGVNVVKKMFYDESGNYFYNGSEAQKESIKQSVRGTKYEAMVDQIIAQMDADLAASKSAAAADDVKKINEANVESMTMTSIEQALGNAAAKYGVDSEEYKGIEEEVTKKAIELFNWALEADAEGNAKRLTSREVIQQLGLEIGEEDASDPAMIEDAIMQKAGKLRESGVLTEADYVGFVKTWAESEIEKVISDDKKNLGATGLRDAGAVVEELLDWKTQGYLSEDEYAELVGSVIDQMQFDISVTGKIKWHGSVKGSRGVIRLRGNPLTKGERVTNDELTKTLEEMANEKTKSQSNVILHNPWGLTYADANFEAVSYNGDIYVKTADKDHTPIWKLLSPDMVGVDGDFALNNKEQREGIYEILVAMLAK